MDKVNFFYLRILEYSTISNDMFEKYEYRNKNINSNWSLYFINNKIIN